MQINCTGESKKKKIKENKREKEVNVIKLVLGCKGCKTKLYQFILELQQMIQPKHKFQVHYHMSVWSRGWRYSK